jgi:hypothetical protein
VQLKFLGLDSKKNHSKRENNMKSATYTSGLTWKLIETKEDHAMKVFYSARGLKKKREVHCKRK